MGETRVVDARGLSCPQPVMLTRKAVSGMERGTVEVLVDSPTAVQNVTRLARNSGWSVTVDEPKGSYRLVLKK